VAPFSVLGGRLRNARDMKGWRDGAADAAASNLRLWAPFEVIEKADAPPGQRLAIRGVFSTEHPDLSDEIVVQDGMDLAPVKARGWLNDNHDKKTGSELGIPTRFYRTTVPDPETGAQVAATAFEGFLIDDADGRRIYEKAKALRGTGRGYGFSVEGKTLERDPRDRRRITKSVIRQIAVTRCPVNPHTALDVLEKSLSAVAAAADAQAPAPRRRAGHVMKAGDLDARVWGAVDANMDRLCKAMDGGSLPVAGQAVAGDSAPVVPQDLEGAGRPARARRTSPKLLNAAQAEALIRGRLPNATDDDVARLLRGASRS